MARIRSIKPETFADELLGALPREVLLLYIGIWTLCDDDGRFRANPALIRSALFPYATDLPPEEVGQWLAVLAEKERILLYEVAGQQYGWVARWSQHQKIDHPSASRLPAPPKDAVRKIAPSGRKSSRESRESLAKPRETLATDQDKDQYQEGISSSDREVGKGGRRAPPSPEASEVAEYLAGAIRSHTPEARVASEGWAQQIDLAIRVDKRTPEQLKAVIDFAHRNERDTFWRANLLSGKKLREKFDTLWIKAKSSATAPPAREAPAIKTRYQPWKPAPLHDPPKESGS